MRIWFNPDPQNVGTTGFVDELAWGYNFCPAPAVEYL